MLTGHFILSGPWGSLELCMQPQCEPGAQVAKCCAAALWRGGLARHPRVAARAELLMAMMVAGSLPSKRTRKRV